MNQLDSEQKLAQKVTVVGAIWDFLLGLAKIVAGYFSQSQALIADGIHSLSDLVTDVFVFIAAANSRQGPDENHPYGHLRFETITTVVLGLILVVVAAGIAFESFTAENTPTTTWYGLAAVTLTIVVKEAIFHYTKRAGEQIGSKMLIANAWHSRSDALSSVAVLIGLGGVYLGYGWADQVASILVAILIGKIAVEMIWENVSELVDTAPDPKLIEQIKQTTSKLKNVAAPHDIRARSMAGKVYLDMHIHVPARASVSEGHYFSDLAVYTIKKQHAQVQDVMVHVDTDDHLQTDSFIHQEVKKPPVLNLPDREQVLADLGFILKDHRRYLDLDAITLHYINKSLSLSVIAVAAEAPHTNFETLNQAILADLSRLPYGGNHEILWRF